MSCCAIQVTTVHSWDLPSLSWVMQEHLRGHRASFRCPECTLHPSIFNAPVTRSSPHEVIRGTRCWRTTPVLWKQWYSSTTLFVFPETAAAWTTFTLKCGFGALDPFWKRNFTYSVFAQHHTHRNSSRSRHERKHSTKYNLGQRITFPMVGDPLGKSVHLLSKLVFLFGWLEWSQGWWTVPGEQSPLFIHWRVETLETFPTRLCWHSQSFLGRTRGRSSPITRWQLFSRRCYSFQHQAVFQWFMTNLHFPSELWVVFSFAFWPW